MIDWVSLTLNAFWVVGLTVSLASMGFLEWNAVWGHASLRRAAGQLPRARLFLSLGIMLASLGAGTLREPWWDRVAWGVLLLTSLGSGWIAWQ
jgi:hypothetical protein